MRSSLLRSASFELCFCDGPSPAPADRDAIKTALFVRVDLVHSTAVGSSTFLLWLVNHSVMRVHPPLVLAVHSSTSRFKEASALRRAARISPLNLFASNPLGLTVVKPNSTASSGPVLRTAIVVPLADSLAVGRYAASWVNKKPA
jgi:hypothetical protein